MESPCINVCILDEEAGLCQGCFRSLDEIGRWGSYTALERQRIMAALEARRENHLKAQQDSARGRPT